MERYKKKIKRILLSVLIASLVSAQIPSLSLAAETDGLGPASVAETGLPEGSEEISGDETVIPAAEEGLPEDSEEISGEESNPEYPAPEEAEVIDEARGDPAPQLYNIIISSDIVNGTVSADKNTAEAYKDVFLTVTPAEGYVVSSVKYSFTNKDGFKEFDAEPNDDGRYKFNMRPHDTTVRAVFTRAPISVSYVDDNGETASVQAAPLESIMTELSGGWYVADEDVAFDHKLTLKGDTMLIIPDGRKLTFGAKDSRLSDGCIEAETGKMYDFKIYGQSGGTGEAEFYGGSEAVHVYSFWQYGGRVTIDAAGKCLKTDSHVTLKNCSLTATSHSGLYAIYSTAGADITNAGVSATAEGGSSCAIFAEKSDISITDSRVDAAGKEHGLWCAYSQTCIRLSLSGREDRVSATSYKAPAVRIGGTYSLAVSGNESIYSGELSAAQISSLAGKTLIPAYRVRIPDDIRGGTVSASRAGISLRDYESADKTITLTATPEKSFELSGITVTGAVSGKTVAVSGEGNTRTFTMPAEDVNVNAVFSQPPVRYCDEKGTERECKEYTVLEGGETELSGGWYIVPKDTTVNYAGTITLKDSVNLILSDGATINLGTESSRIPGIAISGNGSEYEPKNLTIYSQSGKTGALNVYNSCANSTESGIFLSHSTLTLNGGRVTVDDKGWSGGGIYADDFTQNGGILNVKSEHSSAISVREEVTVNGGDLTASGSSFGIHSWTGSITINGGSISASSSDSGSTYSGIGAAQTITLGWTGNGDSIFASSYSSGTHGIIRVLTGKALTDGNGGCYYDTLTDKEIASMGGRVLVPAYGVMIPKDLRGGVVSASPAAFAVGDYETAGKTVTLTTTPDTDYELVSLTVKKADSSGIATARDGNGRYTFTMPQGNVSVNASFAKSLVHSDITVAAIADEVYTGKAITPSVTVSDGSALLIPGKDYTLEYANNVDAGDKSATEAPTVIITGRGAYCGVRTEKFTIKKAVYPAKEAKGGARYGNEGMLELEDFIAGGGSCTIKATEDPKGVLSSNAVLDGTLLKWRFKDDSSLAGETAKVTISVNNAKNYEDYEFSAVLEVVTCSHPISRRELRGVRKGTCSEYGYSGDTYCLECGSMIEKGHLTDRDPDNHHFDFGKGEVVRPATLLQPGITRYTCGWCKKATLDRTDIPCKTDEKGRDLEDLREDVASLSGDAAPVVEPIKDDKGNVTGESVAIAGREVSKTETDPESGKETVVSKLWIGGLKSSYVYTGSDIKPSFHVYDGLLELKEKTDYTVSFRNNKDAGEGSLTVKFKGNYKGNKEETVSFTIEKAMLGRDIIVHDLGLEFTNKEQKPAPLLTRASTGKPVSSRYFKVTYSDTIKEEGDYTAFIEADDKNYGGEATALIRVTKDKSRLLSKAKVIFDKKKYDYTGEEIIPAAVLKNNGTEVPSDAYRMTCKSNVLPGTATAVFEAVSGNSGMFTGTKTATFKISGKRELKESKDDGSFVYTYEHKVPYAKGGARPAVTVTDRGVKLKEGRDYTLSYSKNRKLTKGAETAIITVKGKGSYKGSVKLGFAIEQQSLKNLKATAADQFVKKSSLKALAVTVLDLDGNKLKKGTDFVIEGKPVITGEEASGIVEVSIVGKGAYLDTDRVTVTGRYFENPACDLLKAKSIKTIGAQEYTGAEVKLSRNDLTEILKNSGGTVLIPGTDFEVSGYADNIKKGKAKVTLHGVGSFAGEKTLSFKITEKKADYQGALTDGTWR
ncbi:MAG: hypothetical protein J5829_01550 [Lachnospiraceae bacterium]|nr:hypothetical protein [Lachnospiraceae bacterium]